MAPGKCTIQRLLAGSSRSNTPILLAREEWLASRAAAASRDRTTRVPGQQSGSSPSTCSNRSSMSNINSRVSCTAVAACARRSCAVRRFSIAMANSGYMCTWWVRVPVCVLMCACLVWRSVYENFFLSVHAFNVQNVSM
jgi:hypothetical protein